MDKGLGAVIAPPRRCRQIEHNVMKATNVEGKHDKFIKKIFCVYRRSREYAEFFFCQDKNEIKITWGFYWQNVFCST